MALNAFGRPLQRVAVVGSGNLGPDLALYLSRALAPHDVPLVLHDPAQRDRVVAFAGSRAGGRRGQRIETVAAIEEALKQYAALTAQWDAVRAQTR